MAYPRPVSGAGLFCPNHTAYAAPAPPVPDCIKTGSHMLFRSHSPPEAERRCQRPWMPLSPTDHLGGHNTIWRNSAPSHRPPAWSEAGTFLPCGHKCGCRAGCEDSAYPWWRPAAGCCPHFPPPAGWQKHHTCSSLPSEALYPPYDPTFRPAIYVREDVPSSLPFPAGPHGDDVPCRS